MKKNLVFLLVWLGSLPVSAQKVLDLDWNAVKQTVQTTAKNQTAANARVGIKPTVLIDFPLPNGRLAKFSVAESSIFPDEDIALNPNLRAYTGVSADGLTVIRFSFSDKGINGLMETNGVYQTISTPDARKSQIRIEKVSTDFKNIVCLVDKAGIMGGNLLFKNTSPKATVPFSNGATLRTYRLAVALTSGAMAQNGNTLASGQALLNTLFSAISLVYERELAIRFTLVGTSKTIFTATNNLPDPFPTPADASPTISTTGFKALNDRGDLLYSAYDFAHTIGAIGGGGGVASLNCVCQTEDFRAAGYSSLPALGDIQFDPFGSIGLVVMHEIGHQFGAGHTFSAYDGEQGACYSQIDYQSAFEPGAGNTLMSYGGGNGCSPINNVGARVQYFHVKTLETIYDFITGSLPNGCGTTSPSNNAPPTSSAGPNYTIPKGTPFTLTGSGTDANSDPIFYTWEEYDLPVYDDRGAIGTVAGQGGYNAVNSATAPLFRTRESTSPARTFPALTFILNNDNTPATSDGEALPQVARTMKFRLTTRDKKVAGGGFSVSEMTLTVANTPAPFRVSSQNEKTFWIYNATNKANIFWDVSGSDAAPINCANVKISFSTDGGQTFPIVLAANTPNSGFAEITIPNNPTNTGRVKVEAIGNVFFDINNQNITIGTSCGTPESSSIAPANTVTVQAGTAALALGLTKSGAAITTITGALGATSPTGLFATEFGGCIPVTGLRRYQTRQFVVGVSGSYTFELSSVAPTFSAAISIYAGAYNPAQPCQHFFKESDPLFPGFSSVTVGGLVAGTIYTMVIHGYNEAGDNDTFDYSITTTAPAGGGLFEAIDGPASPYAYTFLAIKDGLVHAFSPDGDLSSSSIFPAGTYKIYGLSYQGGLDLSQFVGDTQAAFEAKIANGTICGKLSSNVKNVTITPCTGAPTAPTVTATPANGATGLVSTLTAAGCTAPNKVNWFDIAVGGNPIQFDNPVYVTQALTNTQTYYADCEGTGCTSPRTAVTVTIQQGAATITSIKTGNWSDASTWDAGRVPVATDLVIINQNHIVTLSGTGNAKKLTYRVNARLLLATSSSKLMVGN